MTNVKPIPDGYHTVTPYLVMKGAKQALEFYAKAFGAQETLRFEDERGEIGHAEMRIGTSMIMLAEEKPNMGHKSPATLGGSSVSILLYVEDCDAIFEQAVNAGATVARPLANQFYGDRTGGVKDPFGYEWYISTHIEDVSPEEMEQRMKAAK
ncbi:MAG TPA: VOC family protein [Candidatus Koribacter sp.]|jgi:PhnB protein